MKEENKKLVSDLIMVLLAIGVLYRANWGYTTMLIMIIGIWVFLRPLSFKLLSNILLIIFPTALIAAAIGFATLSEYVLFLFVFLIVLILISEISAYVSKKVWTG